MKFGPPVDDNTSHRIFSPEKCVFPVAYNSGLQDAASFDNLHLHSQIYYETLRKYLIQYIELK